MEPLRVEVVRRRIVEAVHLVHAVALDEDGKATAILGDKSLTTYWRSTAKPFQALAVVVTGAADAFGLTSEELAIACGSHAGSAAHLAVVRRMLMKGGLTEAHLQSGPHEPFDPEERTRLIREGQAPTPLHSNCSGKHAALLLSAKHLGAPLENYRDPNHPVQRLIAHLLVAATGEPSVPETVAPDGCGAPIWASSLSAIASAFHRFVTGNLPDLEEKWQLACSPGEAAKVLAEAMAQHPEMVAAKGHWNTRLIAATKGGFIGKGGAEGLFAGAFRDGRAIAVKVQDGNHRATPPAVLALLAHLGWLTDEEQKALSDLWEPPLKNLHGDTVGVIRVRFP